MELLVHLGALEILETYRKMPVYVPEDLVMHIEPGELPTGWESGPRTTTCAIGDRWLAGQRSVAPQVPSAVVHGDSNLILNTTHGDIHRIRVGPVSDFRFDERLGHIA